LGLFAGVDIDDDDDDDNDNDDKITIMTCSPSYREPSANMCNNLSNTAKRIVSFSFPNMEISWPSKQLGNGMH